MGKSECLLRTVIQLAWYTEDTEQELAKGTKEKSRTQEFGLGYDLIPGKFSTFIG